MSSVMLTFNGINGASGEYLLPPMTPGEISAIIRGEERNEAQINELKRWYQRSREERLGPVEGVDSKKLEETGWGVIFAHNADPRVREHLKELLDHRRELATRKNELCYREFTGDKAFRPGDSKQDFLERQGMGTGPAVPDKVPYYLLIVGDPESIPYSFQYQLDVQYAVGRIYFDTLEEYAQYARSVVEVETGKVTLPCRAVFFGVRNPGDRSTNLSATELVEPLSQRISKKYSEWNVSTLLENEATKENLSHFMGGKETPALLFTASHGMGFPKNDVRQLRHQGALLCQDWPGPEEWRQAIPPGFYFAADDVGDDARLLGLIAFHFACYGAGTPRLDDFAHQAFSKPTAIAPHAFVASLPRCLLGHPKGGALAVVGHVERAWSYSFMWGRAGQQLQTFESTIERLIKGYPVGSATEYFNVRYAELSTDLSKELEDLNYGKPPDDLALAGMWTANNDSRSYIVIGDPAVRLIVGEHTSPIIERSTIEVVLPHLSRQPSTTQVEQSSPSQGSLVIGETTDAMQVTANEGTFTPQKSLPSTMAEDSVDYGVFDTLKSTQERLTNALVQFADRLGETLKKAVDDASSLEISTYVSDDMQGVTYDFTTRQFTGTAKLRALTRIRFTGDTLICVPEKEGEIDKDLWAIHIEMVQRAQAQRTELLNAVASAATGLLNILKTA